MVTVQSKPRSVATYQNLLLSEWTKSLPQDALALLWMVLERQETSGKARELLEVLKPDEEGAFPWETVRSIATRIAEGTRFVRFSQLPELPVEEITPKRLSRLTRQAYRLAAYLTLAAHVTLRGQTGFFADAQALGFQAAIHFMLPELRKKHEAEHALLLHAAVLFAVGYSAIEPAHYAYMMSMIHDYLGERDQKLWFLLAAFRFTVPQDHAYLTRAQEVWMEMLDQDMAEEAERFLLSLHRSALPEQQEEVREMVEEAFRFIVAGSKPMG